MSLNHSIMFMVNKQVTAFEENFITTPHKFT